LDSDFITSQDLAESVFSAEIPAVLAVIAVTRRDTVVTVTALAALLAAAAVTRRDTVVTVTALAALLAAAAVTLGVDRLADFAVTVFLALGVDRVADFAVAVGFRSAVGVDRVDGVIGTIAIVPYRLADFAVAVFLADDFGFVGVTSRFIGEYRRNHGNHHYCC